MSAADKYADLPDGPIDLGPPRRRRSRPTDDSLGPWAARQVLHLEHDDDRAFVRGPGAEVRDLLVRIACRQATRADVEALARWAGVPQEAIDGCDAEGERLAREAEAAEFGQAQGASANGGFYVMTRTPSAEDFARARVLDLAREALRAAR